MATYGFKLKTNLPELEKLVNELIFHFNKVTEIVHKMNAFEIDYEIETGDKADKSKKEEPPVVNIHIDTLCRYFIHTDKCNSEDAAAFLIKIMKDLGGQKEQ
jgi:hypothetical protein